MNRKILNIGLLTAITGILSTTLAGCSSNGGNTTATTSSNSTNQHETITIAFPGDGSTIFAKQNDKMLQYLENKFNITIKLTTETWANYDQQTQLWATSGQLPDVFFSDEISNKIYSQWVSEGLVSALPSDLSQYPYVQNIMNMSDVKSFQTNGKMYMMPLLLQQSNVLPGDRGIVVRKDWMEKLNLQQPKTWNDFVNILNDFVTKNPDGKKNVVGLTSANDLGLMNDLFVNEFPQSGWWYKDNGKWIPSFTSTNYLTELNQLHQLYANGLLDKDFSNPNNTSVTKFVNGQAGALDQQPKTLNSLEQAWKAAHPNEPFSDYVEFLQMPPGPDGNRYQFDYYNWWAEEFINSNVDQTKMNRILSLFNYLLSPDGQKLINFGFEGTDYKMVNGKIQSLHPSSWNIGTAYPSQGLWNEFAAWSEVQREGVSEFKTVNPVPSGYTADAWNMYQNYVSWYMGATKPTLINWDVNTYAQGLPALSGANNDWVAQAVASNNPEQVWKSYVSQQESAGLNNQIQQVNQKFQNQDN